MDTDGTRSRADWALASVALAIVFLMAAERAATAAAQEAPRAGPSVGVARGAATIDDPLVCSGDLGEPNDTLGTAYFASCNLGHSGKICSSSDIDYYQMITAYGGSTLITLVPPATRDYDLAVYDANQNIVCASIQPAGVAESCTVAMPAGSTYYLKVYGFQSAFSTTDFYTFSWSCISAVAPSVTTGVATSIERTRATLNVTVNPNGADTSVWSRYGTTSAYGLQTGTYGVGFGTSPATIGTNAPGLMCGTLYHYRAFGQNAGGGNNGTDATFTTSACIPPIVTTGSATAVEATRATLNVIVNPNGGDTSVRTEYGTTQAYGAQTGEYGVGYGDSQMSIGTNAPNLSCGTPYHYRALARNTVGQTATPGTDATFTTPACPANLPTVTTAPVSGVGPAGATLRSTVYPNGSPTTARFDYGPTTAYGTTTPGFNVGAGTSAVGVRVGVRGLTCGTQYHVRATASNGAGLATGGDAAFTTLGCGGGVTAHDFSPFADVPNALAQVHGFGVDSDGWLYVLAPVGAGLGVFRSTDGGATFGGPVSISNSGFTNSSFAMNVDPSDVIHVVWWGDGPASDTYYSRSTDRGQSFSPRIQVRSGSVFNGYWTQNAVYPVVASDGWGHVYVAFSGGTRTAAGAFVGYDVWVARSSDGGATFQPEFYTYSPTPNQDAPRQIVATPTGFYVLFVDETTWDLYVHRGDPTAFLLNRTRVNANTGRVLYNGDVAAEDVGTTLHVVYSDTTTDSEGDILYCKSLDAGATWQPCVRVNDSTYRWQESPRLMRDGYGTLHVVWADFRSNFRYQTYYAASMDGGATFSPNVNVAASQTSNNFTQARIGLDEAGRRLYVGASRDYSQVVWSRGSYERNPPAVTTLPASAVTAGAATLNSSVNPNGTATSVTFRYGPSASYGSETAPQDAGSGTAPNPVAASVTGLTCGTLYHFRAVGQSVAGATDGADVTFTTTVCPPVITPQPATGVTSTGATLNAGVNPNGAATSVHFDYGTSTDYGSSTTPQDGGAGTTSAPVSAAVGGLACATTYQFRAVATNAGGTMPGGGLPFTTGPCPPTVTTQPATSVSGTGATLNASVDPNGAPTSVYFEFGTSPAYGTVSASQDIGAGSAPVSVNQPVNGLVCGTGYYVRAVGSSVAGTTPGLGMTFDTAPCPYRKGDLNLDLQTDLVLRNLTTGQNVAWLMSGIARASESPVTPDPDGLAWQICGVDDFSGDGRNDLVLWNSADGALEFWLMSGTARVGDAVPLGGASPLAPPWRLSATADFNHDGRPDLVWRNLSTQKIAIWTLDAAAFTGAIVPSPDQAADANWEIVAALDFNADGNTDLLWYNWSSGRIVLWFMNASVQRISGQFTNPDRAGDSNWKVLAAGDYGPGPNGLAGTNDIVWRNATSGKYVVWYMDNAGNRTAGSFTVPDSPVDPLGWTIAGPR